jgi:hypothetical protein
MDTKSKTSSLKKKRRIFGWAFLASILVFVVSNVVWTLSPMPAGIEKNAPKHGAPPSTTSPAPVTAATNTAVIVSVVSLLTSVTSLIGFFSTTVLAWRKEKRETISAELEIKKKELELEKLKIELARAENGEKNERT